MEDYIIKIFRESCQVKEAFVNDNLNRIAFALKSDRFPPSAATIRHHANLLAAHTVNFQAKSNKLIRALSDHTV